MAGKATTLAIRITSDNQAKAGFDDAEKSVGGFSDKLDKASVAAAGVLGGIGLLGKQAFDAASEMQQASGSIDAIFGDMADSMKANAADAYESVGLSTSAYEEAAAVIGSQLKNAGMDAGHAFDTTAALIAKGADMAAVFGGTAADAVDALSSALKGEMDPIEKYGISLNQAAIDAQKSADGHAKLSGAADKAAQTQAILELITRQSAATQGQWSAQAGTAAESTQIAQAAWENASGALGQQLLPFVTATAKKLGEFAIWAQTHKGTVTAIAGAVAGLAIAILAVKAAMTVWSAATKIATGLQVAWNIAMDANPIGLIVIALAAIVGGLILAYQHSAKVREIFQTVGHVIGEALSSVGGFFETYLIKPLKWAWDKFQDLIAFGKKVAGFLNPFDSPARPGGVAPAGGGRGVYGASAGGVLRSAGLTTAAGAGAAPAGAGGAPVVVNVAVTFTGLVGDPVAVGAQIDSVVREWSRATGRQQVTLMGGANR